jgi:hypothetical protein
MKDTSDRTRTPRPPMKSAGYSGTPLARKLGIRSGSRIRLVNQPGHYFALLADMPADVRIVKEKKTKKDLIHYFATSLSRLEADIGGLRKEIEANGAIWVSWPKKSSGISTDLDENVIRNAALKNKLVDVKVCAVDDVWSALKLVIRLKDRS